jgi:signal transduction histidine kinase
VLGRLSISQKLIAVVVAPLLVLVALTASGFTVFQRVKVNGPEFNLISQNDALIADILPPPNYLIELHYVATQMVRGDVTQFDTLLARATELEKQYNERIAFWQSRDLDPELKSAFLSESVEAGNQYINDFNAKFVPQMQAAYKDGWVPADKRGDFIIVPNEGLSTYENSLVPTYNRHRAAIDKTVALATVRQQALRSDVKSSVSSSLTLLTLLALIGAAASAVLGVFVANAIRKPILQLTNAANKASTEDLPRLVKAAQTADVDEPAPTIDPVRIDSTDELGELARAFSSMQSTAVGLASEQAIVRRNVSENLVNLARRNQTLLGRSLSLLTDLEQNERDPEKLHELFRVDHLTTRMRRNAESLLVLAGADPARTWSEPVDIGDTVRAAVSAIESFDRVDIVGLESGQVKGTAVSDIAHLLAELIENSTAFSAPTTRVAVIGKHRPDGYLLVVTDDGIGMSPEELENANSRIQEFAAFDATPSKVLGLNVVGRLAARHGVEVTLAESATAGIAARIVLPASIMEGLPMMDALAVEAFGYESPELAMELASAESTAHWTNEQATEAPILHTKPERDNGEAAAEVTGDAAPADGGEGPSSNVRELRRNSGGLVRRVRGAQMLDSGPAATADDAEVPAPEQVMASLSNLQRGVRHGADGHPSMGDTEESTSTSGDVDSFMMPEAQVTELEATADTTVDATDELVSASVFDGATLIEAAPVEAETVDANALDTKAVATDEVVAETAEATTHEVTTEAVPSELVWTTDSTNVVAETALTEELSETHSSVVTLEHIQAPVEAAAPAPAPSKKSGNLTKRVRGAQMPDTGPVVDRTLGSDADPDQVRSALSRLQRGVASANAANEGGDDASTDN